MGGGDEREDFQPPHGGSTLHRKSPVAGGVNGPGIGAACASQAGWIMSAPTVVAFDLSLTSTGVADRNGTRRITPKTTGAQRLVEIRDAVEGACWLYYEDGIGPIKADLVVIEGYSYASGNKAHDVGELGGVVRVVLYEAGIRYEVVAPKTLKTFACDNGNASKDDMLLAAVRRLGYEGKSKDEADALWLYALTMHALGAPIVDVPKSHLRALKALPWATGVAA